MSQRKPDQERLLEERRKYAEEMARKFYKNHKKEEPKKEPAPPPPKEQPASEPENGGRDDGAIRRSREKRERRERSASTGPTFEDGIQAWKNVFEDTHQGAKKLLESVSGRMSVGTPAGSAPARTPGHSRNASQHKEEEEEEEIQMENLDDDGEAAPQTAKKDNAAALLRSKSSDNTNKSADVVKKSEGGGTAPTGGQPITGGKTGEATTEDSFGLTEDNISNEDFMNALRKRLKQAQDTERELVELKKKYMEASVTSEQLVIMLGKEKQVVEQLKEEIKTLTKHNVRLVEILGNVKATTGGGKPSPRPSKRGVGGGGGGGGGSTRESPAKGGVKLW